MCTLKITLKAARVNAGFTLSEASNRLDISVYTLINYEKGKTFPPTKLIPKIEALYNIKYENINFYPKKYALSGYTGGKL